jgi:hypothetical protein
VTLHSKPDYCGAIKVNVNVKVKVKYTLEQATNSPEEEKRCSSTLSLPSALDEVGGQRLAPAALLPGKNTVPICRRLGGLQGRSGRVAIFCQLAVPGLNPECLKHILALNS